MILDGDPGVGKSLLTIDLAARLSRGGALPDESPSGRPHTTLLLSAEDNSSDTIRPRVEAAGADLDRVIVDTSDGSEPLRFPADLATLEEIIRGSQVDLVVIDPVMAFLPPVVAANSDQSIRTVLTPLKRLAEQTDCTILLVRHLRKKNATKAVYRGLGSIGFVGSSRAALFAAFHPGNPALRVLAVSKPNLSGASPALAFAIRGDGPSSTVIEWMGPLGISADSLGLPLPLPLRPRDRAGDWLHRELANGPRKATELLAAAARAGIPETTLRRAKIDGAFDSQQIVEKGDVHVWYWYDPAAQWPKDAPFPKPFRLAPLGPI